MSNAAGGASPSVAKKKKKGSMYSLASSARRARPMMKEEVIGKKINDLFKEKEQKMIRTIEEAMFEDNHSVYTRFRQEYAEKIEELEKERGKILRRKKNKKEKMKMLHENSYQRLFYIANAVNNTVKYYKKLYFQNDYYRMKRILEIEEHPNQEPDEKAKVKLDQLVAFYDSPFKEDRRFSLIYIAQLTRDRLKDSNEVVNTLFFDKIFELLLQTEDQFNKPKAFEILSNLVHGEEHRQKLANDDYLRKVYEVFQTPNKADNRTLEKLSWMTTLICFYPDMIDQIIRLNLLQFIIKISGTAYPSVIRSNAVLALSLLTYHEKMFDELIRRGVIDLVMDLCKDSNGDIQVKQFSTLALVHFALNKQSINILIQKGVMDLFNSFGSIDNGVIQTNVSWIFLALCNNGITGKTMVENGITRDMFLVSCNPQFNQIRHLVIAGFAELGRCTELKDAEEKILTHELQKIKETAIVGMHQNFKCEAERTIQILLRFTVSEDELYKIISFWALKDYILLNHEHLVADTNGIIQAFVNGSIYSQEEVNTECANAISFLITHHLVYSDSQAQGSETSNFVLDALMHLTGSASMFIRTRAFSTLSTLSTYCSSSQNVMEQIFRDIKLPSNKVSRQYYEFIMARLQSGVTSFTKSYLTKDIEQEYAGLFCLLRIAKDPTKEVVRDAAEKIFEFIFLKKESERDPLNETFFIYVFHALKHTQDHEILLTVLKVIRYYITYSSPLQSEVINPDTILWLLEILEEHKDDKLLGCKAAITLLQIVSKHQIVFDYQEVAIIKKFNQALQNLDVFEKHSISGSISSSQSDKGFHIQPDANGDITLKIEDAIAAMSAKSGPKSAVGSQSQQNEKASSAKAATNSQQSFSSQALSSGGSQASKKYSAVDQDQLSSLKSDQLANIQVGLPGVGNNLPPSIPGLQPTPPNESQKQPSVGKESQKFTDKVPSQAMGGNSMSMKDDNSASQNFEESKSIEGGGSALEMNQSIHSVHQQSSKQVEPMRQTEEKQGGAEVKRDYTEAELRLRKDREIMSMQLCVTGDIFKGFTNKQTLKDALISSKQRNVASKKNSAVNASKHFSQESDSEKLPQFTGEESPETAKEQQPRSILNNVEDDSSFLLDSKDTVAVEQILRESLIKSFMVIFTHDHSQHLLLNRDLIDIAFNCLEFADEIAEEAQQKLAKLISIIFKFPQVQKFILKPEIVHGVTQLLSVNPHENKDIIANTIKACTYLTMDYEFVNQPMSLELLKKLVPLIDFVASQENNVKDITNMIFSITNIVKGSSANRQYFFEQGCTSRFIEFVLDSQSDIKFIDLCVQSLREIASSKTTLRGLIDRDGALAQAMLHADDESAANALVATSPLMKLFHKCFHMTEAWLVEESAAAKSFVYRPRPTAIGAGFQGVEKAGSDMHIMEQLTEEQEDKTKSLLFATNTLVIRNNTYYILGRCIKAGLPIQVAAGEESQLIGRILADLQKNKHNYIMFENIMLALSSFEVNPEFAKKTLIDNYRMLFIILSEYPNQEHKIGLLKAIIHLVLKSMALLCGCSEGHGLFHDLFRLIETTGKSAAQALQDEEMQENIMWMINSMIDAGENSQGCLEVCLNNNIVQIIAEQISADKQEATLLQTLLTLTSLSKEPKLLEQFKESNIFSKLQAITLTPYFSRNLDLKTALYQLLEVVSSHNPTVCDQLMQEQGFILIMVRELNNNKYKVEQAHYMDIIPDLDLSEDEDVMTQMAHSNMDINALQQASKDPSLAASLKQISEHPDQQFSNTAALNQLGLHTEADYYDMIDRQPNANQMIEAICQTIANICQATRSNHAKLINMCLIDIVKTLLLNYCPYGYYSAMRQPTEQIDVTTLTIGNVKLLQSISQMVQCITKNVDVQELSIQNDIVSVIKHMNRMVEYEVLTNIFLSLGNLMLSQIDHVRRRGVELGCLDILLDTNENSEFLRIRRICNSVLQQTDPRLFEYNEAIKNTQPLQGY